MTAAMVCMLAALSAAPVAPKVGEFTARTVSMPGGDLLWPQFRGPGGEGHAAQTGLPLTWSETENVVWKTPIAGSGWSSAVIQGNLVWITTTVELPLPPEATKPEPKPEDEKKDAAPDAEKKPAPPAKKPPMRTP